jgi:formylglycine-generating enzyme required for sulfatase activity
VFGEECAPSTGQCEPADLGEFVALEPGVFDMGSPVGEPGRNESEELHSVTLTHRFELMTTEVTRELYARRTGRHPSGSNCAGPTCPVDSVNWHEAVAYCNALSALRGLAACYTCSGAGDELRCEPAPDFADPYECPGFRLPTEAEWEYAARAGTTTSTYHGTLDAVLLGCESPNPVLDPIAWFCGNASWLPWAVATKEPNAWGLYDMLGNLYEMVHDWSGPFPGGAVTDPWGPAAGTSRGRRGGSYGDMAEFSRAAHRSAVDPLSRNQYNGFRVARTLP